MKIADIQSKRIRAALTGTCNPAQEINDMILTANEAAEVMLYYQTYGGLAAAVEAEVSFAKANDL